MKKLTVIIFFVCSYHAHAQQTLAPLTVEKIMRDLTWMGTSPSNVFWGGDGKTIYFNWNPEKNMADSLYAVTLTSTTPQKLTPAQKQNVPANAFNNYSFNKNNTSYVFSKNEDVYYVEIKSNKTKRITQTTDAETNPQFSFNNKKVVFARNQNLFAWDIATGETIQLTNFLRGSEPAKTNAEKLNAQEQWLKNDQVQNMAILKERKEKRDAAEAYNKNNPKQKELKAIYTGEGNATGLSTSANGRFISYRIFKPATGSKNTIIPNYVTENGFTTDINGRTKVGAPLGSSELFVYDRQKDTVYALKADSIEGIKDLPGYLKDYPKLLEERTKKAAVRNVTMQIPVWNESSTQAVIDVRSQDNKDRWLMLFDKETGKMKMLDRQHDEAWIGGPGIGGSFGGANMGWIDEDNFWFQSEASGFSHLYKINVTTNNKIALTSGNYEVQQAQLSLSKKYFYITTNEVHPGEQHFYRLPVNGGKATRITSMAGANQVTLSPDEKLIAILYSYTNKPWELYLQQNKPGAIAKQITSAAQSAEFKTYAWREPEIITVTARDGAQIYSRLYKPATPHPAKPAVIFVHGAGYLQNAHKWWSSYFREYMFHNLLADAGYYVLDMDYRASAGYGRNVRTGIYRFMGGKDLTDNVDGAKYLVEKLGVDANRIGIYGGSYGGFITLMAMFTTPGVFKAGAALRPVTDWAHYNHGYTSNILNEPYNDSIAYKKSSPIYYAAGLKDNLLICHGMVDVNVHFQDVVRLSQRLIELKKDNWQLAVYPVEDHGFAEPTSWTDEYKRIFNLFEEKLKK
jgi:dipeptidyl aminopeptidase/acylaminoacyl peptidase